MEEIQRIVHSASTADQGRLQRFTGFISDPAWRTDTQLKIGTIAWLQETRPLMAPRIWSACVEVVAALLEVPIDRARAIVDLPTIPKIARALQPRPPVPDRPRADQVYPAHGWLGRYLDYASGNECPFGFHFWTAASTIAAACRRNVFIDMGAYTLYPNLYVLLIAPSGGRKGFSLSIGTEVLQYLNVLLGDAGVHPADHIRIAPKKVSPERFFHIIQSQEITDPLTGRSQYSDSVAYFGISELTVLLGRSVFHSEQFIHILTDLWTCPEDYPMSTFDRGDEVLRNVAITLVGCSTEDWLFESVTNELFTGGFMSRCMLIPRGYTDACYPVPFTLDPVTAGQLAAELKPVATAHRNAMPITGDGMEFYQHWYRDNKTILEQDPDPRLAGYYQRRPEHLLKLGMILAVSSDRGHVTDEDLKLSDSILQHEESHIPPVLSRVGEHPAAKVAALVLARIRHMAARHSDGLVSRSDLSTATFSITGGAANLNRSLESLMANGTVELVRVGRTTYYRLPASTGE